MPDSIIEEIISHLPFIDSIDYIEDNLSIVDKRVMNEVMQIIYEVFDDIQMENNSTSLDTNEVSLCPHKIIYSSESDYFSSSSDSEMENLF